MRKSIQYWNDFWSTQTSALHNSSDETHYQEYGRELQYLFDSRRTQRVLEIGCGDGALYGPLGFDRVERYRGVDISETMLEKFRVRYPDVDVLAGDGYSYCDDREYDLVFSNGVVQFFDSQMLAEHFAAAERMLAPGGRLVCASVPWKLCRGLFYRGSLREPARWDTLGGFLLYLKRRFVAPGMGHWYFQRDIETVAARQGFRVRFLGSLHYPYRFHAVLIREADLMQCDGANTGAAFFAPPCEAQTSAAA